MLVEDALAPLLEGTAPGQSQQHGAGTAAAALSPAPELKPLPRRPVSMCRLETGHKKGSVASKNSHVCLSEAVSPRGSVSSNVKASGNKQSSSGYL